MRLQFKRCVLQSMLKLLLYRVLSITIFFSFLVACQSGPIDQDKHQKDFEKAVALYDQEKYDRAIELFLGLSGTSVDQVLVGNYLAQSYLESAGFDALAIFQVVNSLNEGTAEEEYIDTASYLIDIMPNSNLQVQRKFKKASKIFDDSKIYDHDDPMIFSYRLLYKSVLLLYHIKNLGEDVRAVHEITNIREKLEYLDQVRKSEPILQTEETIFDIVELFPKLSKKIKKIVSRVIKNGVFKFAFNGKIYHLDFTNREDGGLSQLFFDLFETHLLEFIAQHNLDELGVYKS